MIEITFPVWFILVGIVIYIAGVYVFVKYRDRQNAIRNKKHCNKIRYFNWLSTMGLLETRRYFTAIGQDQSWNYWWDV